MKRPYTLAMAICARCGEDNPGRARFCLACGGLLAAEQLYELAERAAGPVLDLGAGTGRVARASTAA